MKKTKLYKSPEARKEVEQVYLKQLEQLELPYERMYVNTRFGKTHIVKAGNPNGMPILLFPGRSVTPAFQFLAWKTMLADFCFYGVDVIGHPGFSDEGIIPRKNYGYAGYLADILDELHMEKGNFAGISLCSGVVTDFMCVYPERVNKVVLYVPGSIYIGKLSNEIVFFYENLLYKKTGNEKWKEKCLHIQTSGVPYHNDTEYISSSTSERCMITEAGPTEYIKKKDFAKCQAPIFLLLARDDWMFDAKKIQRIVESCNPNTETHFMPDRGHVGVVPQAYYDKMKEFLRR